MDKETVRVHVQISGRVQGVCYRWFTRDAADEIGVTGWVRNLPDGAVELVAEGSRDRIELLLDYCRRGPDLARVDDLEIEWEEPTGEFGGFSIRH
jgi:acylphosphatase